MNLPRKKRCSPAQNVVVYTNFEFALKNVNNIIKYYSIIHYEYVSFSCLHFISIFFFLVLLLVFDELCVTSRDSPMSRTWFVQNTVDARKIRKFDTITLKPIPTDTGNNNTQQIGITTLPVKDVLISDLIDFTKIVFCFLTRSPPPAL